MWSRIQNTELASEAILLITQNAWRGCEYHNLLHVEQMYEYLEETNEPYDEALDWAILFHDIVYDEKPEKESRSGRLFVEMCNKFKGFSLRCGEQAHVYSLIMRTRTREFGPKTSNTEKAIIRADLHALTDKIQTIHNFVKIMDESMNLYDCTVEEFAENNIDFMIGLYNRVKQNAETVDKSEKQFYYDVLEGINLTISLANSLK